MSVESPSFRLTNAEDILGTIPYLLGYHPTDSLVVLLVGADQNVRVASRIDLAQPAAVICEQVAAVAALHRPAGLLVAAYGPLTVMSAARKVVADLAEIVPVQRAYLVAAGHYFCLTCMCPQAINGAPFDASQTVAAARAAYDGMVALPDRDAFIALTAPDPAEQAATATAMRSLSGHSRPAPMLRYLMDLGADGIRLSTEQAAQMAVLLAHVPLRDQAWQATTTLMWQRDLWLDLVRRVPDAFLPGPGGLAAWCAWMRGEDLLATAVITRVLAVDPQHRLSLMIASAITAGISARDIVGTWPLTGADNQEQA